MTKSGYRNLQLAISPNLQPAIDPDSIYSKSRHYIFKAIKCKNDGCKGEYQLYASFALELLGKAHLAWEHPSLIVNPEKQESLLAAAGIKHHPNVKTIHAKAVYSRLHLVIKEFDAVSENFCFQMSQRRNAELHSGELPFENMELKTWEGQYWYIAELILSERCFTLDEWLGTNNSDVPKDIARNAKELMIEATKFQVETKKKEFSDLTKKEKKTRAREAFAGLKVVSYEHTWEHTCPSCENEGFLGGYLDDENVVTIEEPSVVQVDEEYFEYPSEEEVTKTYIAEEFICKMCKLHLRGYVSLEAGGIDSENTEKEIREREYEPEYNNE